MDVVVHGTEKNRDRLGMVELKTSNSVSPSLCYSFLCFDSMFRLRPPASSVCVVFFFFKFIYLFMAVLGLRFCARAFCSCGERGSLFIAVRGPLTIAASLVAEHKLQMHRLSSCGSRA